MKIRKGDKVRVLTGKDRGKEGVVSRAIPADDKVIIAGVNLAKRHRSPPRPPCRAASSTRPCRSTSRTSRS